MYYTYPCPYCRKVFYAWDGSKEGGSSKLYYGIKKHLIDYDEDHKEYQFDDPPKIEIDHIYKVTAEMKSKPSGGYPV